MTTTQIVCGSTIPEFLEAGEILGAILDDPKAIGEFLRYAARIAECEKIARRKAIELLLRGTRVPGWCIRRQTDSFVLPASLEPLAAESLSTVLESLGSISERRYRSLCAKCGLEPDLTAIIKAGAKVVLSRS